MFDREYVKTLILQLKSTGVEFTAGLTEEQLMGLEQKLGGVISADLKTLLSVAVPASINNESGIFPTWGEDPEAIIKESQSFIDDLLVFDIETNDFWHESFGSKPESMKMAKTQALEVIHSWPKLMPVFAHRFVVVGIKNSPVFSYQGPSDTIYYGNDLVDYLHKEFGIIKPEWSAETPVATPPWDNLFFG